jgi:hypothetical protein
MSLLKTGDHSPGTISRHTIGNHNFYIRSRNRLRANRIEQQMDSGLLIVTGYDYRNEGFQTAAYNLSCG